MSSSQPGITDQSLPTAESSTVPYERQADSRQVAPGTRVVDRLDQLANTLDRALGNSASPASAGRAFSGHSGGSAAHPSDDENFDSYLQKYMERLTGKSQPEQAVTSKPINPLVAEPMDATVEEKPAREPSPAPERRSQLSALRDVANDSARRAVDESSQIKHILLMRRAYIQAKFAALASLVAVLAFFGTHAPYALTGSLAMFAVAIVLTVRFLQLFRREPERSARPA